MSTGTCGLRFFKKKNYKYEILNHLDFSPSFVFWRTALGHLTNVFFSKHFCRWSTIVADIFTHPLPTPPPRKIASYGPNIYIYIYVCVCVCVCVYVRVYSTMYYVSNSVNSVKQYKSWDYGNSSLQQLNWFRIAWLAFSHSVHLAYNSYVFRTCYVSLNRRRKIQR